MACAGTGFGERVDGQRVTVLGGDPVQSPQTTGIYHGYLPVITVQLIPVTEVFESSPKNGQPVNVQLIPVTLAP